MKSTSKTLGIFSSIILISFVMDIFLKDESLFRMCFLPSYTNIEKVIYGEINAPYLVGITMSIFIIILLSVMGEKIIVKSDLLGGEI